MNAKGFFLPDGQRPSKRDLLDLQCVRGRQYFFISIPCLIFILFLFRDGSMNIQEFVLCWNKWIKKVVLLNNYRLLRLELCQIVRPKSAIIIVDVQNDFISGDCEKFYQIYLNIKYM